MESQLLETRRLTAAFFLRGRLGQPEAASGCVHGCFASWEGMDRFARASLPASLFNCIKGVDCLSDFVFSGAQVRSES